MCTVKYNAHDVFLIRSSVLFQPSFCEDITFVYFNKNKNTIFVCICFKEATKKNTISLT